MKNQVQRAAAFDNFDPDGFDNANVISDTFDPDNIEGATNGSATTIREARVGSKMQVSLSITNSTLVEIQTELFSALDSWVTRLKPELVVGAYAMIPALSLEGIAALIAAPTGGGVVGFNAAGNLEVRAGVGAAKLIVGCSNYPYNSLHESTKTLPFYTSSIRMTVSTDPQIDQDVIHFTRTFGGAKRENRISPRAYFRPDQQQNKIIDIPAPFTIDSESGLSINTLPGEQLRLAMFIQRWGKPNV